MDGQIKDRRVARKIASDDLQESQCRIWLVEGDGTVHAIDAHVALQLLVRHLGKALLQRRQRFRAMTGFRQLDSMLYDRRGIRLRVLSWLRGADRSHH